MKRSEMYYMAMKAVLMAGYSPDIKLAILEVLMDNKTVAEYQEERNGSKKEEAGE